MDDDLFQTHPDLADLAQRNRVLAAKRARAPKPPRKRRRIPHGKLIALACVLTVALTLAVIFREQLGRALHGETTASGPLPTTQTAMAETAKVDLRQPFVTTPAAGWADGEAGLIAPASVGPVGHHTAAEVADAYVRVRQVVIASRLDRRVIEKHDYEPLLALLSTNDREHVRSQLSDLASTYTIVTRISDKYRLLPAPPKVNGMMWAAVGADGELVVHTNFVFAYAFDTGSPDKLFDAMDIVAVSRFELDYRIYQGPNWSSRDQGISIGGGGSYVYSMACTAMKQGALAPLYSERQYDGAPRSDDRKRYFDPNLPMPTDSSCR